jgi:hypothetical protein
MIMTYRLVHYLAVDFVDPRVVYAERMVHEPLTHVTARDVHIIAGAADTGEILCYATLEAVEAPAGLTLRAAKRPLLPVEEVHGWGCFNRLAILPDLPLETLRESGRFVKHQCLAREQAALGVRAPVEVIVATHRALLGPLRDNVTAVVGQAELAVTKRALDALHIPSTYIYGTIPYVPEGHLSYPPFAHRRFYPGAYLCADLVQALPRLEAAERALALSDGGALLALQALKESISVPRSRLEPPEGLPALTDTELPERTAPMSVRRELLLRGERLRTMPLLSALSVAEATALGAILEGRAVDAGELIVRQGEMGETLFLIDAGQAELRVSPPIGVASRAITLGPGDHFGESGVVSGEAHPGTVVALTPMTLWQLHKHQFARYLAPLADVCQHLKRTIAA